MGIEVEFQRALYTRIDAAKASLGLVEVYDIAPQAADGGSSAAFPYATIGTVFMVEGDTQTTNGFEVTFRVHVFSRTGSMAQCKGIQGGLYALLHRQELTITGFNNYVLHRTDTTCMSDLDGKVHGVCEYRALVETA